LWSSFIFLLNLHTHLSRPSWSRGKAQVCHYADRCSIPDPSKFFLFLFDQVKAQNYVLNFFGIFLR
jgi:hypothetical protein